MSSSVDKDLLQVPSQAKNGATPGSTRGSKGDVASQSIQPDGGWGWVVCMTSLACNGTVFGVINTFGILYVVMRDHYAKDDPQISFKTTWVGSVATGVTFLMSMISSILSDRIGIRPTAVMGGILAFIGMLSSAFVEELMLLYLTFGIFLGVGFSFTYAPSLVILGHYFKRHMGLVNGIVTFGSSVFTISLAQGLPHLLSSIGLRYTLIFLSGMTLLLVPYGLTWKPTFTRDNLAATQAGMSTMSMGLIQSRCTDCYRFTKMFFNVSIWRNKGYIVWAVSNGISLFGYFIPFFHLVKHVNDVFPDDDGNILVTCISITSGVARIAFGKVADLPWVNRIRMQQLAFIVLGVCTLCIPFSESFAGLIAITLIMGICDGVFICLLGPIAFDLVGERGASQALGFLFGIVSIPMTVGPPMAGLLYDKLGDYNVAFHVAGCPPIIGALIMFFVPRTRLWSCSGNVPAVTSTEEFAAVSCHDIYSSRLDFETTIEAPTAKSVTPEVIPMNNVGDLTDLTPMGIENGATDKRSMDPSKDSFILADQTMVKEVADEDVNVEVDEDTTDF